MNLSDLADKTFLVMGIANRRSVAFRVARLLLDEGATVLCAVRSDQRAESVRKLLPDCDVYVCDVEYDDQIEALAESVGSNHSRIHGFVHSIAFASYETFSG